VKYVALSGGARHEVAVTDAGVIIDGTLYQARLHRFEPSSGAVLELEGRRLLLTLESRGRGQWIVSSYGDRTEVEVMDQRMERARRSATGARAHRVPAVLAAPMPGLVVRVPVVAGQEVEEGTSLVVLEAMKMENELRAAGRAVVDRVEVRPGQPVEKGDILVRFREKTDST
jgi:pyruvate carboxylase subunit B